jgi:purine-binding chemotaxis protein CheW
VKSSDALASIRPPGLLAPPEAEPQIGTRALLGFIVGKERYALPLSSIREILRPLPLTEVPRAGSAVMGVVSVRGTVTTLVDLRKRLNVDAPPPQATNRILLCDQGNEVIGLFVDSVLQVYRLREDEVELAPALGGDAPAHILGIGRPGSARVEDSSGEMPAIVPHRDQELLILLDPIALLKA